VALCQARTSTKPLWGLSSSNPYHPSHVPNTTFGFLGLEIWKGEDPIKKPYPPDGFRNPKK
jgi:hypothetical protein